MELEAIINQIEQYGYFGLFLWLWIGVLGIPIPNEIITMSVGYAGSEEFLDSSYLFGCTYLGLLAANTTSYVFGRIAGKPVISLLSKRKRSKKYIEKSMLLINKYRTFSLVMSYFLPGLRTMVPLLFGISGLKFFKFATISYTTIFIWTTIYFTLGRLLGDKVYMLMDSDYQVLFFTIVTVGLACFVFWKYLKYKQKMRLKLSGEEMHH
ncbi:DedA family protein [Litchfieldia salsa]|uniref:Membrane protein DedA, SNARE-associated domain n=1 Tax=Litchfieldia salsa TaxID=930152 RepID=A0A1H0WQV1_9BACI|nr:DedA family protein [Litchfieldia salsa]SDP93001.1 membrane protein DedA, SNARE-associated domain [Litchfieldia salsa]